MSHFVWTTPTARKVHICHLCGRQIRQGEKYLHMAAALDNGAAWDFTECRHCQPLKEIAWNETGDFEYQGDLIQEWGPQTVPELRLKALWRKKWQRADGTLYPVPS